MSERSKGRGPLDKVRVLEFGQIAAGPFAGSLFADLGADVVKVENPNGGDGMRDWPPLTENDAGIVFSENFASVNRNKRSIALDLKEAQDIEIARKLSRQADIIIENFRPGVLRKLGLGYDDLQPLNGALVYCSISGFGQQGPYAKRGAFDVTIQAISGLMSVTGNAGEAPAKCGVPVADFCAGLYGAYASLAAFVRAKETGIGAYVDCSMLGCLLGISALQTSEYFGTNKIPQPLGSAHPRNAPYQAFEAADTYFVLAAGNNALWIKVLEVVEMPELARDERFASPALRARNQETLRRILESKFQTDKAQSWLERLDELGVPCAPINNYQDVLGDIHVKDREYVRDVRLPNGAETKTIAFPVEISDYSFDVFRSPPTLGEHTAEVLSEWTSKQSVTGKS